MKVIGHLLTEMSPRLSESRYSDERPCRGGLADSYLPRSPAEGWQRPQGDASDVRARGKARMGRRVSVAHGGRSLEAATVPAVQKHIGKGTDLRRYFLLDFKVKKHI